MSWSSIIDADSSHDVLDARPSVCKIYSHHEIQKRRPLVKNLKFKKSAQGDESGTNRLCLALCLIRL